MTLVPPNSFVDDAAALGVVFEPGDLERLGAYLELLLDANTRVNLTAVTDPTEVWSRHALDSLSLLSTLDAAAPTRVIDVGSGGGLPGIPLAIALPDVQFTLLEATGKKARFLEAAVATLGLDNVRVVHDRAETAARERPETDRDGHREQYDVVLRRAVGRLPTLLELTVPLARVGGLVLAIKGCAAPEEIADAKEALYRLHAHVIGTPRTPTGTLVVIEKQRRTPKIYPRRPGEPKRAPLGGGSGSAAKGAAG